MISTKGTKRDMGLWMRRPKASSFALAELSEWVLASSNNAVQEVLLKINWAAHPGMYSDCLTPLIVPPARYAEYPLYTWALESSETWADKTDGARRVPAATSRTDKNRRNGNPSSEGLGSNSLTWQSASR